MSLLVGVGCLFGATGCGGDELDENQIGCLAEIVFSTIPEYEVGDTIVLSPCPTDKIVVDEQGRKTVSFEGREGGATAVAAITGSSGSGG